MIRIIQTISTQHIRQDHDTSLPEPIVIYLNMKICNSRYMLGCGHAKRDKGISEYTR